MIVTCASLTVIGLTTLRPGRRRPARGAAANGTGTLEALVATELERSRRYERPLTLVHIVPLVGGGRDGRPPAELLDALRLRSTDQAWSTGAGLVVVAPETDADAVPLLCQRLRAEAVPTCRITSATFPDDGLTVRGLLARLVAEDETPTPTVIARLVS
jgi:hypothetical protein